MSSLTSFTRSDSTIHRENELIRRLAGFRYLTEPLAKGFLFTGSALTPLSQDVIIRRVLRRLKRQGLIVETARVTGPAGGSARLVYLLTATGYSRARKLAGWLPAHQPRLRGSWLMGHGLMCAEVALAFHRASLAHPGHQLVEWRYDWQSVEGLGTRDLIPDGYLEYESPRWGLGAFIEVDLATEGARVYAHKVERYIAALRYGEWRAHFGGYWPIVMTIAPTHKRAFALERVTRRVLDGERDREKLKKVAIFWFAVLDDVLGPHGPLGRIWRSANDDDWQQLIDDDTSEGAPPPSTARASSTDASVAISE